MAKTHQAGLALAFALLPVLLRHAASCSSSVLSIHDIGRQAGYYALRHSIASRMFYVFWESKTSKRDPIVMWLNGGLGCSSMEGLFVQNGHVRLAENFSLLPNEYGWDKASNVLYVDQPIATGFSYSPERNDSRHSQKDVSQDLYDLLQAFFKDHPRFAKNALYITGESYAGHYIPALASRIRIANRAKQGIPINLMGFAIGNGNSNPVVEYNTFLDYALHMGMIDSPIAEKIRKKFLPNCQLLIKSWVIILALNLNIIAAYLYSCYWPEYAIVDLSGGDICGNASKFCENILSSIVDFTGLSVRQP